MSCGPARIRDGPEEVQSVIRDEVIIREINELWLPVYPYMVDHLLTASGVRGGSFLDLGPFAGGLALSMLKRCETLAATVIDDSELVLRWVEEKAAAEGHLSRLTTRTQPFDPISEPDGTFDLVAVRGAFFFLTPPLLREVKRVLKPGGFGWVGGGYGPTTPEKVIAPIADRSRILNEAVGKRRVSPEDALAMADMAGVREFTRVGTEGGLWLEVRA
jgi:SAM-dependent methyltransferase